MPAACDKVCEYRNLWRCEQRGEVIVKSELFTPEALIANVELDDRLSFYNRFGNVVSGCCLAWIVLLAGYAGCFRKNGGLRWIARQSE